MCLAIPGKIREIVNDDPLFRVGRVLYGAVEREANLTMVPEAAIGDYVLVHAGVAINTIDEDEAHKVFAMLEEMDELDELQQPGAEGTPRES